MTRLQVRVHEILWGKAGKEIELRRYTSKSDTVLKPKGLYIVAAGKLPRFAPAFQLLGFSEVKPGQEQRSLEAHRLMIQEIGEKVR